MMLSQKLMLIMMVWTTVSIFISAGSDFEVLFTLEMVGFLVIREYVDAFATTELKERLDVFFYAGLFIFAVLVIRRIFLVVL